MLFNRFIKKAKAIQYLSEIEQKMSSDFKMIVLLWEMVYIHQA